MSFSFHFIQIKIKNLPTFPESVCIKIHIKNIFIFKLETLFALSQNFIMILQNFLYDHMKMNEGINVMAEEVVDQYSAPVRWSVHVLTL